MDRTRTTPRRVGSLEELKRLAAASAPLECFIVLAGGAARSSKEIVYYPPDPRCPKPRASCWECQRPWQVLNEIDDSFQYLGDRGLAQRTNIVKAIEAGALFALVP